MKQVTSLQNRLGSMLMLGVMLVFADAGYAQTGDDPAIRLSQSIEQVDGKTPEQQAELLDLAELQEQPELKAYGSREAVDAASKTLIAAHPADQVFRVYDAQTLLSADDDEDGFYHQLRVTFDADVDHGDAFVYARLYLSFEGGPWNHYFTTNVFHILEEVSYDDYEVFTRLLEGYPTGYYDVLIELYDADWDLHVASYGPDEDGALRALPLEDLERDYLGDAYPVSDSHGGGGSLSLLGLLLLALWRGFSNQVVNREGPSHPD